VLIVPTVDTVEEAREVVHWAMFPPLGGRSLGGGPAFDPNMWGNVPGGYRNTINDNLVIIVMIENTRGAEERRRDREGAGHQRGVRCKQRSRQFLGLQTGRSGL